MPSACMRCSAIMDSTATTTTANYFGATRSMRRKPCSTTVQPRHPWSMTVRSFTCTTNHEESYIAALDTKTGKERWRTTRDEKSTWATPFVWKHAARTEIIVPGKKRNRSYDLDGNVLWEMDGQMSNLVIPSPFEANGMVYISSGYFADQSRSRLCGQTRCFR